MLYHWAMDPHWFFISLFEIFLLNYISAHWNWVGLPAVSPNITPHRFYGEERGNNGDSVRRTARRSSHLLSLRESRCGIFFFLPITPFCFLWNLMQSNNGHSIKKFPCFLLRFLGNQTLRAFSNFSKLALFAYIVSLFFFLKCVAESVWLSSSQRNRNARERNPFYRTPSSTSEELYTCVDPT